MIITLEHNGSAAHNALADELRDLIENDLPSDEDYTVEYTIGNSEARAITLYDESNKAVAIFYKLPTLTELAFYLNTM